MNSRMKAGISSEQGLMIAEVSTPCPASHQVLVRVAAAGLNRADLNAARGAGVATKASLGKPIGMEWAGEVIEIGDAVSRFRPGDIVMCSGSGGYAEYAVSDESRTIPLASGFDVTQAAALPLALMTAHDAVITHGKLQPGQSILVHGASSAVGLMAMQIARWRGAEVIAGTSSDMAKRGKLVHFGATEALDPSDPAWPDNLLATTGGSGVDTVIDMVSGASINQTMRATAVMGNIVNVGRLGGMKAEFDFDLHSARRLNYIGVTFRTRSPAEIRILVDAMKNDLLDALASAQLTLPIDRTFALTDAASAQRHMAANAHFGKIVLIPD